MVAWSAGRLVHVCEEIRSHPRLANHPTWCAPNVPVTCRVVSIFVSGMLKELLPTQDRTVMRMWIDPMQSISPASSVEERQEVQEGWTKKWEGMEGFP